MMPVFNEPLMIATAPDHILVGLSLFFAFAAVSLFFQAVEQGLYPGLRGCLSGFPRRFLRRREKRQRWVYYALGGERAPVAA